MNRSQHHQGLHFCFPTKPCTTTISITGWPGHTICPTEERKRLQRVPYPFPVALETNDQYAVVQAAYRCVRALGQFMSQLKPFEVGLQSSIRAGELWKPASSHEQFQREIGEKRADQRAEIVKREMEHLSLQFGKTGFHDLDTYVPSLHYASPGRLVRERLPEDRMLANYLHYVGWLDYPARRTGPSRQEAATALAEEQKACGLNHDSELILWHLASHFLRTVIAHQANAWTAATESGVARLSIVAVQANPIFAAEARRSGKRTFNNSNCGLTIGASKSSSRAHTSCMAR